MKKRALTISTVLLILFTGSKAVSFLLGPKKDNPLQHDFVEAARLGNLKAMEKALASGATVDGYATSANGASAHGPALFEAIEAQKVEAVRWLLENGANPNHIPADVSPLEEARWIAKESPDPTSARKIIKLLREHGARL